MILRIWCFLRSNTKTKKAILFDVYQTLIDIDINDENKKINQEKAWVNFAKSLEKYGITITPAELTDLNDKQRANFYIGKDKKVNHHNFCQIMMWVLKEDLGVEVPQEKICSLIYEYHKIARGYSRLYSGVAETLEQLSKEYILSTASYTQGCFTQPELRELGIEKFFSYFVYTSNIGFHKASLQFYEECDCLLYRSSF